VKENTNLEELSPFTQQRSRVHNSPLQMAGGVKLDNVFRKSRVDLFLLPTIRLTYALPYYFARVSILTAG